MRDNFDTLVKPFENRFPMNSAITGLVASLGETVNIRNIESDSRFDAVHSTQMSLLSMPIKDGESRIIGVVSLVNKKTGFFTLNDESFVEAFGIFFGISLANVSRYEEVKAADARSQVALDIMTYHASSNPVEARSLAERAIPSALSFQLQSFRFTDCELEDVSTLTVSQTTRE